MNHDIDDAIRAGILSASDIPREISVVLGETHGQRIDTLVWDMIQTSREAGAIYLSPKVELALDEGVLSGGSREVPLCEVEVELKSGSREAAVIYATQLAVAYGLKQEKGSKFRRAKALAEGEYYG